MPLKPQHAPCFDPSQWGGPTVQAWLFTLNIFFYANYVLEDTVKICYAVSLLRGPTMDSWRAIVTKPMDNVTLPTREGQTGPWALSYFVEVPQYRTWDAWCAGLHARFEPIAASIVARQKLRTWCQLGSVQEYTSGFLALCEQVGYMHETERIDRYIGGLEHDIAQEIQLRGVTDFQEILAMAEKLDFFRRPSGATGAGGAGDAGAGGAGVSAGVGGTGDTASARPRGARTRCAGAAGTGGVGNAGAGDPTEPGATGARGSSAGGAGAGEARVGGTGAGGVGAAGAGAVDPGAGGAGGTVRPRPYFVPLLQQVLGVPSSTSLTTPLLCPPPDQSQPPLLSASPLPAPSPYTEQSGGLTEHPEPASRPVSPICTARRVPHSRPPPVPGMHAMALRPSSIPLRVPLPAPPESSLPEVPDPKSDRAHAASPTVSRLLTTAVTDPSFESAAASALVADLLDFAAACRLDYATPLVAESESASPPSVGGECALGTDVLEDRQEDFECLAAAVRCFASMLLAPEGDPVAPDIPTPRSYVEAITGPYSSQWQAAMDAEMASWKSKGTYVDEVPPPAANIVDGMWIFRGVDYFQTFSPTPKMTTLWVLLHVAAQRDYELHSLDFSTAFLQGSLHEEIWLRRPPGFTVSFPAGTQWSLRQPVYGLRQVPREWHDTLRTTLAALGFAPSTADPSLFLRTDTSLPPFYVLVYVDDLIFATTDTKALTLVKSELQKQHTCTDLGPSALRLPVLLATAHSSVYQPLALSSTFGRVPSWLATQRSSQGYTFSLGSGSVSWRSTHSPSVLSSSCEAEIYAWAMASQELRWLTYLLTDLGEQPRSPPVLYVVNKAMIALCQEHRLEHRTKHIALR
ncbi:unnamed protein product [Closterium sp. NIES-53]